MLFITVDHSSPLSMSIKFFYVFYQIDKSVTVIIYFIYLIIIFNILRKGFSCHFNDCPTIEDSLTAQFMISVHHTLKTDFTEVHWNSIKRETCAQINNKMRLRADG